MIRPRLVVLLGLALGSWLTGTAASAQSMAEAAAKEEQRREELRKKGGAKETTSYDNADLGGSSQRDEAAEPEEADEPAARSPSARPTTAARRDRSRSARATTADRRDPEAERAQRARDEARWRRRVADARRRLEQAREELAAIRAIPNQQEEITGPGRIRLTGTYGQALEELAEANRKVAAAEQALKDLLEQARRAGIPPGWLR